MYGTIAGDIIGIGYFLLFQAIGIIFALRFLRMQKISFCVLIGSVIGSFSVAWLPIVCAIFMQFTVSAHIVALVVACALLFFYMTRTAEFDTKKRQGVLAGKKPDLNVKRLLSENPVLAVLVPLLILTYIILIHHTLSMKDGAMFAGQSTYGDMNMHLGFITSIARQGFFPPEYSILPGTQLSYPFLSDSISSSIYIWGASLRISYLLPMFFALAQVFFGMVCIAKELLSGVGRGVKVLLAFVFFFFNGGFGFWYFIQPTLGENFTRIFTAFYETPTNLTGQNVQWHNIICDMLIPQRATLFGWAILFPTIALLLKGLKSTEVGINSSRAEKSDKRIKSQTKSKPNYTTEQGKRKWLAGIPEEGIRLFILAGVLAGGLPLIHTHSFLALGVLCAGVLTMQLFGMAYSAVKRSERNKKVSGATVKQNSNKEKKSNIEIIKSIKGLSILPDISKGWRAIIILGFLFVMTMISMAQMSEEPLSDVTLLRIGYFVVFMLAILFIVVLIKNISLLKSKKSDALQTDIKGILFTWGIFLGLVLVLAIPQLINFTFKQAQGDQFIRGSFNWANNNPDVMDNYIIFYLKNIGVVFILSIFMFIFGARKQILMVLPASLLWIICEFILFQPNPYDNNKLLLVSYLFFCIATADFVCGTTSEKVKEYLINRKSKSSDTTNEIKAEDGVKASNRNIERSGNERVIISKVVTAVFLACVMILSSVSAALTIGREYVSEYELYGADYVALAEWIEDNSEVSDIFLTATNHNNAVASLTGRSIVCGAGTFLYYHGLDYFGEEADVRTMYESPVERDGLLEDYGVSYIVIGGQEYGMYSIPDVDEMRETYEVVYDDKGVLVLKV